MTARLLVVLGIVAFVALTLPFHGCGDNDNSAGAPCCPVCGDGVCSGDEGTCECPRDCPSGGVICPPRATVCGDGHCERVAVPGESHESCPQDCPLDCRQCEVDTRVYVNGTIAAGAKCPDATTFAYRTDDILVCHACDEGNRNSCAKGTCRTQCGPGCEHDTGGCCPVRVCSDF